MPDNQLPLFSKGTPGRVVGVDVGDRTANGGPASPQPGTSEETLRKPGSAPELAGRGKEASPPTNLLPGELTPASSLLDAINGFHQHMVQQGFSINTIKAFQADLRLLTRYVAPNRAVGTVGEIDLNRFLTWMRVERGTPCSPKSYARRLTTLKVFFAWLAAEKILAKDPAAPLVHERPLTPLPEILYDSQANTAIRRARDLLWAPRPDARPYLLMTLVLQTGIKKSECTGIKLDHIDFSVQTSPVLYIRYADPRRTFKERKLALGPGFSSVFRQYIREYQPKEYLFECTARNLEYVLAETARLAGITGGISFEQLRWTCAVRDYRNGMPADQLREKLGLSTISWRETLPKIQRLAGPAL